MRALGQRLAAAEEARGPCEDSAGVDTTWLRQLTIDNGANKALRGRETVN